MRWLKRLWSWWIGERVFDGPENHYGLDDESWQHYEASEGPR